MTPAQLRRLAELEQRAGRLAPPAGLDQNVAAWLRGLSADELDKLEVLSWAWPAGSLIPAEVILATIGRRP